MKIFQTTIMALLLFPSLYAAPKQIAIETQDKGLYLIVEDDGRLRQSYFGDKLLSPEEITAGYNQRSAAMMKDAYPTFGVGYTGTPAIQLAHNDGNLTTILRYCSHTSETLLDGAMQQTTITLRDEHYPLEVKLIYKAYLKENVLSLSSEITNREKGDIRIISAMSSFLNLDTEEYWLKRLCGTWAHEMQMVESQLVDGITTIDSKVGVRTTQDGSPTFILSMGGKSSETRGETIVGSLAWSGNYKLSFEVDNAGEVNILCGMNDFMSDYTLEPTQSLSTPEMIIAHSNNGIGEASRNLHSWVRRYNIQDGDTVRPIVLNSWEGVHFTFDEQILKEMIDDAADMGAEIFVLDDGWFGNDYPRDNSTAGLGDWQVNTSKLPNGIKPLTDRAKQRGIRFGLWVEPEMVNPESALAHKHPEWILRSENRKPILMRTQEILDLSNPKVQEFAYNVVADQLRANPDITYIKWDSNRHVADFGSTYLDKGRQSQLWIDYTKGLYSVYERLAADFPEVIFQACASGGGRADYGAMKYHHEIWGSDNTDAESRLFINWGHSQYIPAIAVGSHVSSTPNKQTKQSAPIKFRFDVSMSQRMGVELQPAHLTPEDLQWTKSAIAEYKRIRPVVQLGDQYRLNSPYDEDKITALNYVSQPRDKALLFVYIQDYIHKDERIRIKMQGLDPQKSYTAKELLPAIVNGKPKSGSNINGKSFSGDYLMKVGIEITLRYRYESAVIELQEAK